MTKGNSICSRAVKAYYDGIETVDEICYTLGVSRSTLYSWVRANRIKKRRRTIKNRRALNLSKDETELLLLVILEADAAIPEDKKAMLRGIENRLLNIADDLTNS
jgi:transposase-like protein